MVTVLKSLRCPYCGGQLGVEMERVGPSYISYEEPSGYECLGSGCLATWDMGGDPVTGPNGEEPK